MRWLGVVLCATCALGAEVRPRAREAGLVTGILPPGPLNPIADVAGVLVGHATLVRGRDVRTGVTAVLPHAGATCSARRSPPRSSSATPSGSWPARRK